ncbi:MAG: tetratricopeptide repeat protein [Crocinitomicaceae bacterium]
MSYAHLLHIALGLLLIGCSGEENAVKSGKNPFSGPEAYSDSLNWEIRNSKNDTIIYNAYTAFLEEYAFTDLKIANAYLDSLKIISDRNPSDFFLGRYHLSLGDILDFEGKNQEAEKAYEESVKYLERTSSKIDLGTALNNLGYVQNHLGKDQEAISSYERALEIRTEANDSAGMGSTLNNIGYVYDLRGDLANALKYYTRSMEIRKKIHYTNGVAQSLNNIAYVYQTKGDIPKAVDYYEKAIRYFEELQDTMGVSVCLNNIGILYQKQEDFDNALEHYQQSLDLIKNSSDKESIARTQSNLAYIYLKKGQYETCRSYYNQSLKYLRLYGDKLSVAGCLNNIANAIVEAKSEENPISYLNEALTLYKSLANQKGIADVYISFSRFYRNKGNLEQAKAYAKQSQEINEELAIPEDIKAGAEMLYEINKLQGDYKEALLQHERYTLMKDKIQNEKNKSAVLSSKFQIEYERQMVKDSVQSAVEKEFVRIQYENQLADEKNKRFLLFGGFGFLLIIAVLLIVAYQRKRRDNRIIESQKLEVEKQRDQAKKAQYEAEEQKLIVEEKNNEILDSIQYAKRLQNAILPSTSTIKQAFKDAFILYKPKDIVAGDFYWFEDLEKEDLKFIAVADCTGHGVPGAMVSVVCSNALSKAVLEEGLRAPSVILERVKDIVISTFDKSEESVNDGMDIGICKIYKGQQKLEFAGANIALVHVRAVTDTDHEFELDNIKGTKRPVGKYKVDIPFENNEIVFGDNDRFFMYSDGYADQFGGENHEVSKTAGKKLKSSNLRKLILSIQERSMEEQKEYLDEMFYQWKGSLEQIDDVCIVGFVIG